MKEKPRFKFIDYLRGGALLVMIEVHVINSMLISSIKSEPWFSTLIFINGLVAPAFLFISGFAFYISSDRKLDELRNYGKAFWRKIGRIVVIFLAGYSLHFPFRSVFISGYNLFSINWVPVVKVDILQCIAVGLLVMFVFRLLIKDKKLYDLLLLISGVLIILVSPLVWNTDFTNYLSLFFAAYFNTMQGSLFPLFPWLGFMFLGATACNYYLMAREKNEEKKYIYIISVVGVFFVLFGNISRFDLVYAIVGDIVPNPLFFILRLGYILILLVLCWYYADIRKPGKSFVLDVSRESLLVYWLHLVLIYGVFWNGRSLTTIVNNRFGIIECGVMTIAIAVLMIFIAKLWGAFKMRTKIFSK